MGQQSSSGEVNPFRPHRLENLLRNVAEEITRHTAANVHASMCLKTGRFVEAIVVLDAAVNKEHLTRYQLEERVAETTKRLLEEADLADEKSLLQAYLKHRESLDMNEPRGNYRSPRY